MLSPSLAPCNTAAAVPAWCALSVRRNKQTVTPVPCLPPCCPIPHVLNAGQLSPTSTTATLDAIAGLDIRALFDASKARFGEADRPFWARFCTTQMVSRHYDAVIGAAKAALHARASKASGTGAPDSTRRGSNRRSSMSSVSALAAELKQRTIALVAAGDGAGVRDVICTLAPPQCDLMRSLPLSQARLDLFRESVICSRR